MCLMCYRFLKRQPISLYVYSTLFYRSFFLLLDGYLLMSLCYSFSILFKHVFYPHTFLLLSIYLLALHIYSRYTRSFYFTACIIHIQLYLFCPLCYLHKIILTAHPLSRCFRHFFSSRNFFLDFMTLSYTHIDFPSLETKLDEKNWNYEGQRWQTF